MTYREPDKEINVHDIYKPYVGEACQIARKMTCPYALMILNCHGDFNIATLTRTGSCMGARTVYTVGRRKFDRRPLVGCNNYTNLIRLDQLDPDPVTWFKTNNMFPIFIEQGGEDLAKFNYRVLWTGDTSVIPCLVVGSECDGIAKEFMSLFPDSFRLTIAQPGVIRSLNVCNAGAMAIEHLYNSYRNYVTDKYGLM
jgi:tRNA G18 (ribose-2'-O)-methylase SpoU